MPQGKEWKNRLKAEPVTTYISKEQKEEWKKNAKKMGVSLSEFLQTAAEAYLNKYEIVAEKVEENRERLAAEMASVKKDNERLRKEVNRLEKREIGVGESRVLKALETTYREFDEVVQDLINTQGEATYRTLMKLSRKGIVQYSPGKNAWKLRREDDFH